MADVGVTGASKPLGFARGAYPVDIHNPKGSGTVLKRLPPGEAYDIPLRCLLPHCPERWPLELYWDAASQTNEIGRAQGVTAAFNGIVRQLRKAGRYEDVSPL